MTTVFDYLMYLWNESNGNPTLKEIMADVGKELVRQASSRVPSKWNYENWKEVSKWRKRDEYWKMRDFLNATHDALDHTDTWHLKVFNAKYTALIYFLQGLFVKKDRTLRVRDSIIKLHPKIEPYMIDQGYKRTAQSYWQLQTLDTL